MPRTNLCKPANVIDSRMDFFSGWFMGQMKLRKLTAEDVGEWLGCSRQGVYYKVEHNSFSLRDALIIFVRLGVDANEIGALLTWGGT